MEAKRSFVDARASTSRAQNMHAEKPEGVSTAQETYPSLLKYFLQTCMKLLRDQKEVEGLQNLIDNYTGKGKTLPQQRTMHKVDKSKKMTCREMRLNVQIGDFEMDQVILDFGFDVNVFLKQTWKRMGKPTLQWSPIQLRMVNQQKVIPMRRLHGVIVDIEGTCTIDDFEVIEIVDGNNPYPTLLGIDWEFDMSTVINLKKHNMTFEKKELRVIVPLDLAKGA